MEVTERHDEQQASVFADRKMDVYKYRWAAALLVHDIAGGIPTDPKVAEGWIKRHLSVENERVIADMVKQTMKARGTGEVPEGVEAATLCGFKRNSHGLYIEGRQVKAAIKEASNVAFPKRKWGPTSKGTHSFFAEHVFVLEDQISLGVSEASRINQRFISTWRGQAIGYDEIVSETSIRFTVFSDREISDEDWAEIWIRGEQLGLGAVRSQGFGKYAVVEWERND